MPHAKRPTTPTTAQETEAALVIGYWMASRSQSVPRICERHMPILQLLDDQEERRIEVEKSVQVTTEQRHITIDQNIINQLQQRKQFLISPTPSPEQPTEFKLGPGPLTNENTITPQPPLPMVADPSAPYRQTQVKIGELLTVQPVIPIQSHAIPGTIEGALEAAKAPPTEGAKVTFNCPICGKPSITGEVHSCEQESA